MIKIKSLLLLVLITVYSQNSFAQLPDITQYSENPAAFMEEIKMTFEVANIPKSEIKEYMSRFTEAWNNPRYNQNLKNATLNTFNLMLRKRIKILPNYQIYLNAVMNFVYSKQTESSFESWQGCVMNILYNESIKNYTNFLEISENLFLDNIFYKTPVYEYKSSSSNFRFEYDKGPKITFPALTIICFNGQRDSTALYDTKGVYYPNDGVFKGSGGKVTWLRGGLLENVVWAEIKDYEIDLKRGGYIADSAIFYNKEYFNQPIKGTLTEKVISEKGRNISYPRFESYNKKLKLENIVKNIDYTGGISMRGPDLIGSGDKNSKAELIFKKGGKPFLTAKSRKFGLSRKDDLKAEYCNINISINGTDSIIHPSVSLKYDISKNKLTILRIVKGVSKAPFYNSYHQLNMYFEEMVWITTSDTIKMSMMLGNLSEGALFESINFFRVENYDVLKGMDLITSLISLRDYSKQNNGKRDFSGNDFARFIKSDPKYFLPSLVYLAGFGFLTYDAESDMLHINSKVNEYMDDYTKKTDYDVILFPSFTNGDKSAELNLKTNDLTLFGVKQISLSDSQYVVAYPAEQKLVVKKNRNFDFKGVINAGYFTLFGKDFTFDYDKFTMYLKNVDSVRMKARAFEEDTHGERPLMTVTSVLEKLNGTIEIDNPKNKSGIKPYSKFPIFTSETHSYVYYDKRYIQKGLYPKNKFYFDLDPFVIDSLDNFKTEGVSFPGELVSAGIFPTIRDSLRIQPDFSLGFTKKAPPEGYPMYGGKANFSNTIVLNGKGLGGDGSLKYLTSTTQSNSFVFLPDSVNALAQAFDIEEQQTKPEYPQVHGEDVNINFRPYKDLLRAWNNKGKTISAHNKQSEFEGLMKLTPELLTGRGLAKFGSGRLQSRLIKYGSHTIDADTSNFSLQSDEFSLKSTLSFTTENVKSHIDFNTRKGEFASNGSGSIVRFPVIQYICFMQSFNWDMDSDDIEFGAKAAKAVANQKDINLQKLEFISTHPKQDSLRFEAASAKFNPRKNIINASDVDYIKTADALVYPDSGKVFVEKNANMRAFSNAKIAANSITKLHNLYNCNVNIAGRKKYTGSGYYDYIDDTKKKQTFFFSAISVDTTIQTVAETDIPESLGFKLNQYFEYKGKVKLQATKNFLVFEGNTRLTHNCAMLPKTWFRFETEINPDDIYIPIGKDPVSSSNMPLAASLMVNAGDTTQLYGSFLSPVKSVTDSRILSAEGFIHYDKPSKEYRISNKDKLVEQSLPGNYLSLNTKDYCSLFGEGKLSFGESFGQLNVGAYGNANYMFRNDSTLLNMIMYFDFFFDDNAIEKMGKSFSSFQGLTAVDYTRPVFEKQMREMLGKGEAERLISQLNVYGKFNKLPDELKKTLFLTSVKMVWDKNSNSFKSIGQIGVGNINKAQINKMVDGKIEIIKKRGGDIINIYLELDENNWYYFNYNRGTVLAVSSSSEFNDIIKNLKPDKRKQEVKGQPDFYFNLCAPSKKAQFLRKGQEGDTEEE
jgi:hypothetical protein